MRSARWKSASPYWRKTAMEERILEQNFGPAFDDYRRRSWAVIPRVL